MEQRTTTFAHGKIVWRLPNVIEETRLLGKLGFRLNGKLKDDNDYVIIAGLMEAVGMLVDAVDATIGDTRVTTWEDALNHREFKAPLVEISNAVWDHLLKVGSESKKKAAAEDSTSRAPSRKKRKG